MLVYVLDSTSSRQVRYYHDCIPFQLLAMQYGVSPPIQTWTRFNPSALSGLWRVGSLDSISSVPSFHANQDLYKYNVAIEGWPQYRLEIHNISYTCHVKNCLGRKLTLAIHMLHTMDVVSNSQQVSMVFLEQASGHWYQLVGRGIPPQTPQLQSPQNSINHFKLAGAGILCIVRTITVHVLLL